MEVRQCVWPINGVGDSQKASSEVCVVSGSFDSIVMITSTAAANYAVRTATRMSEVVLAIKVDAVSFTEHTNTA